MKNKGEHKKSNCQDATRRSKCFKRCFARLFVVCDTFAVHFSHIVDTRTVPLCLRICPAACKSSTQLRKSAWPSLPFFLSFPKGICFSYRSAVAMPSCIQALDSGTKDRTHRATNRGSRNRVCRRDQTQIPCGNDRPEKRVLIQKAEAPQILHRQLHPILSSRPKQSEVERSAVPTFGFKGSMNTGGTPESRFREARMHRRIRTWPPLALTRRLLLGHSTAAFTPLAAAVC